MWAGQNRYDRDNEPLSEINVTPLVDVMLVLLIIFMVTAPLMTQGVDVNLPNADAPPMTQNIEPLMVTIKADGTLFLQKKSVTIAQMVAQVQTIRQSKKDLPVYVRGDAATRYEDVARVMSALTSAGIEKVGLVTESDETRQRR